MSATVSGSAASIRISTETPNFDRVIEAATNAATGVTVIPVGPTGAPFSFCLCTLDATTAFHTDPTAERVAELAETLAAGGVPTDGAHAVVEHNPETSTLPIPEDGLLSVGRREALGPCGWVDPTELPGSIREIVASDSVLSRVEEIGLCGRGRADGARDEPIAALWRRSRDADGDPVVVIHAADTDGTGDELLCRGAAGHVLDTAELVADVVGASDVIAFASETATATLEAVGSDIPVHTAPETYLVGEPTMALEALEGNDRIEARRRPPGPEEWGLYSRPTVIHTPRTLLQLRALLSGASFDGTHADPGTRLVTIRGAVSAPATVELSTTQPLSDALSAVGTGGGTYVVGGQFGGFTDSLDVPASAPALSAGNLGTNGRIDVLGEGECLVAAVGDRAAFAREENCGRCVPCREGSIQLHERLREIYDGSFEDDGIRSLARVMGTTSLCAFGEAASRPVRTALERFEPTFRAHAAGRCPAGQCEGLQ